MPQISRPLEPPTHSYRELYYMHSKVCLCALIVLRDKQSDQKQTSLYVLIQKLWHFNYQNRPRSFRPLALARRAEEARQQINAK